MPLSLLNNNEIYFKCTKKGGLYFSGKHCCEVRKRLALDGVGDLRFKGCLNCEGPELIGGIPSALTPAKKDAIMELVRDTQIAEKSLCKCGRGPVLIRKNGVSAGRCKQCIIEDGGKRRGRPPKKMVEPEANMKSQQTNNSIYLRVISSRKEAVQKSIALLCKDMGNQELLVKSIIDVSSLLAILNVYPELNNCISGVENVHKES